MYTAPFATRGWILLFRPAIGMWMVLRIPLWWQDRTARTLIKWAIVGVVLIVFMMGFTAIQWTGKASVFSNITVLFPRWQDFPAWPGGFNPNEWAGAATWIVPALFALVRYRIVTGWHAVVTAAMFAALAALLFLSQSLSGIAGASAGVMFAVVPLRRIRWAVLVAGAVLLVGNLAVLLAPAASADALAAVSGRPSRNSLEHRAVMWERANRMLTDHPWTGVGIALYRSLRAEYPTPGYEHVLLPHPHNEALQFAADLGIPGLIVFGWMALSVGVTVGYVVASGTRRQGAAARALCAGLLSHAVFGLTDAIPIWDRFAILGWGMLALLAAVERSARARESSPD
ncbi:MAG: O-antigen ligase family protein [Chloroflexi bacterium]|nr:O-antigen ligase family protein [Chloroflexota bacterium]